MVEGGVSRGVKERRGKRGCHLRFSPFVAHLRKEKERKITPSGVIQEKLAHSYALALCLDSKWPELHYLT